MLRKIKIKKNVVIFLGSNFFFFKDKMIVLLKKYKGLNFLKTEQGVYYYLNKDIMKVQCYKKYFYELIKKTIFYYRYKLKLKGIGFRFNFIKEKNILECKVGYSHSVFFFVPFFIFYRKGQKKQFFQYFKSKSLNKLYTFINKILNLKKIDPYKLKGVLIYKKFLIKREGKKNA